MFTLKEHFIRDGRDTLCISQAWGLARAATLENVGEVVGRLHLDFTANATYVSLYVPNIDGDDLPEANALDKVGDVLKFTSTTEVEITVAGERHPAADLQFTGQVYLYTDRILTGVQRDRLLTAAKSAGHRLSIRDRVYAEERNRFSKPRAFISHDSRDKLAIAHPLAERLQKMLCPVWYDRFSLVVGDSLRESIERGLSEAEKCILILTPSFLSNDGWGKREYDSIFTREVVERRNVILPVWHGVTASDVFKYSPVLADRVGIQWSEGVDAVASKLLRALDRSDA